MNAPQILLQTVLQNQQSQIQQHGSVRITKPYELNTEVLTDYTRTTYCDVLPQSKETCYCYVAPYFATCNI